MKRVLTAAVGIPLVLLATLYAPLSLFSILAAAVAALSVEEFLALGRVRGIGRPGRWFLIPAAAVTASFGAGSAWTVGAVAISAMALMTVTIFRDPLETALGDVAVGLSAVAYCCVTLGFLILLPRNAILVLFAIIWVGDSAAYYGGRAFGRRLLAPRVSPKKTVEGGIAGLAGSLIAGATAGAWLLGEPWTWLVMISGVTAIAGQVGDLAESALKRSAGVKDSSSILPGHGGILDRLDSLFFATPVFYWLFNK